MTKAINGGIHGDAKEIAYMREEAREIFWAIEAWGVTVDEIGQREEGSGAHLHTDGQVTDYSPQVQESAYTLIKKGGDRMPAEMSRRWRDW